MSTQNTPAPCFTPRFTARLVPQQVNAGQDYYVAIISAKGYMSIATVYHPSNKANVEEENKDKIIETATLFAAAPELLAACKWALDSMYAINEITKDLDVKTKMASPVYHLKAAIAKATTPQ